jgi:kinesin family protein 15
MLETLLQTCQKEEEVQHAKLILRFRDEKIKQLESLMDGSLPADHYLMEENKALKEEIQLLQPRLDKSPELTRFALENIRLLEQLQL